MAQRRCLRSRPRRRGRRQRPGPLPGAHRALTELARRLSPEVQPSPEEVQEFLRGVHGAPVTEPEPLSGGFWSSAYGYRVGDRELVLRFGSDREWFEVDRAAMAFAGPDLPVPEVLEIGEAFGSYFAISVRHHGRFLENVDPEEADAVRPAVGRMLAALRAIPPDEEPHPSSWRGFLTGGLVDDPARKVSGWRQKLAADPELDRLFRACDARVRGLSEACPERRDMVHGDLLHANVLISEDATRITAVFSWKCSVRGDFLYDVAWCTFWSPWHPGIEALDVWDLVVGSPAVSAEDLVDATIRHHCYELQIGAAHLGWCAWTGDQMALRKVASHTAAVLERGPR